MIEGVHDDWRVRSQRDLYAMPGGLYLIFQVMVNVLVFKVGEDLSF